MEKQLFNKVCNDVRLAWLLAKRDLRNRYASSYAGFVWAIGVPLVYALINIVVFSLLMRGQMGERYGNVPFTVFYFVALSQWIMFAEVVPRSANIIREYSYILKTRVGFPVWIIPLIPLASAFVTQLVIALLCAIYMWAHNLAPSPSTPIIFFVWLTSITITVGVALIVASISVFIPDMNQIVPIVINVIFWLTPILYPPSMVSAASPAIQWIIVGINPFYYVTEAARLSVFGAASEIWKDILVAAIYGITFMILGSYVFRKLRPGFTDVL